MDCMDYMRGFPDKFFELAVVDPPYGIDVNMNIGRRKGDKRKHTIKGWDNQSPDAEYFEQLRRVSKDQIIWGGNHFFLSASRGWIYWDKMISGDVDFSDGELAWTSFDRNLKAISLRVQNGSLDRIHPTQKPIALYEWLLKNYAKPGDKILDTHLGSQSSRIAAYKLGFDFYGTEIDADYFSEGCARFEKSIAMPLFDAIEKPVQIKMF